VGDLVWREREFAGPLRVADGEGRTICGWAVPWDEPAEVHEHGRVYVERFQRGAFAQVVRSPAARVKLCYLHGRDDDHRRRDVIGVARLLEERDRGLWSELRVSRGPTGDEMLELVRDGAVDGLSVSFYPVKNLGDELTGNVVRTEVRLREISLVPWGAYPGAQVAEVRAEAVPTPNLDAIRARLAEIEAARAG
jgi:uncharacterized protein